MGLVEYLHRSHVERYGLQMTAASEDSEKLATKPGVSRMGTISELEIVGQRDVARLLDSSRTVESVGGCPWMRLASPVTYV